MLWMHSKRVRLQATFAKSLLVMFVMQVLLSAACISSANAKPVHATGQLVSHCHNQAMADGMGHGGQHAMSACSHCDTPDMAFSDPSVNSLDINVVLWVMISLPDAVLPSPAYVAYSRQREPPDYFNLLYHTNQRILI